jgi:hypothetical protein
LASEKNVHEVEMTTVAKLLTRKPQLVERLGNDVGPDERAEMSGFLKK